MTVHSFFLWSSHIQTITMIKLYYYKLLTLWAKRILNTNLCLFFIRQQPNLCGKPSAHMLQRCEPDWTDLLHFHLQVCPRARRRSTADARSISGILLLANSTKAILVEIKHQSTPLSDCEWPQKGSKLIKTGSQPATTDKPCRLVWFLVWSSNFAAILQPLLKAVSERPLRRRSFPDESERMGGLTIKIDTVVPAFAGFLQWLVSRCWYQFSPNYKELSHSLSRVHHSHVLCLCRHHYCSSLWTTTTQDSLNCSQVFCTWKRHC